MIAHKCRIFWETLYPHLKTKCNMTINRTTHYFVQSSEGQGLTYTLITRDGFCSTGLPAVSAHRPLCHVPISACRSGLRDEQFPPVIWNLNY
jgi:hypothetical protein